MTKTLPRCITVRLLKISDKLVIKNLYASRGEKRLFIQKKKDKDDSRSLIRNCMQELNNYIFKVLKEKCIDWESISSENIYEK